jgi:hypothetical protein
VLQPTHPRPVKSITETVQNRIPEIDENYPFDGKKTVLEDVFRAMTDNRRQIQGNFRR